MFAKLSGQLQGPQHNHLHLHAEVPSREEAIHAARECLEVIAPQLLAAKAIASAKGWRESGQITHALERE
jgi:hypothetical protein